MLKNIIFTKTIISIVYVLLFLCTLNLQNLANFDDVIHIISCFNNIIIVFQLCSQMQNFAKLSIFQAVYSPTDLNFLTILNFLKKLLTYIVIFSCIFIYLQVYLFLQPPSMKFISFISVFYFEIKTDALFSIIERLLLVLQFRNLFLRILLCLIEPYILEY